MSHVDELEPSTYIMMTNAPTPMSPSHQGNSAGSSIGVSGVMVFQIGVESSVELDDVVELEADVGKVVIAQSPHSSMASGVAETISGVDRK